MRTWLVAAVVLVAPLTWGGRWGAVALASVLAVVAGWEAGRLARLPRPDRLVLVVMLAAAPVLVSVAGLPGVCALLLILPVSAALPALLAGDTGDGARRAAMIVFAATWIGVGTTPLVLLDPERALAVCAAVAMADVAAWCAGKGLGRRGPLSRRLTPISPNKTWAGVVGAAAGAAITLGLLGQLSVVVWLAVLAGGIAGDLLESLVKRGAGVKDASDWVPGFGGLLDRLDSLLVALPLVALPTVALPLVAGAWW